MMAVSCLKTRVDDPPTIFSLAPEAATALVPPTTRHPSSWQTLLSALVQGAAAAQPEGGVQTHAVCGAPPVLAALEDPDHVRAREDGLRCRISGCLRHGPVRRASCPSSRCSLPRRRLASWGVMGSHLWTSIAPGDLSDGSDSAAGRLSILSSGGARATASARWLPHERPRSCTSSTVLLVHDRGCEALRLTLSALARAPPESHG